MSVCSLVVARHGARLYRGPRGLMQCRADFTFELDSPSNLVLDKYEIAVSAKSKFETPDKASMAKSWLSEALRAGKLTAEVMYIISIWMFVSAAVDDRLLELGVSER